MTLLVLCFCVGGGGVSWIRHGLVQSGLGECLHIDGTGLDLIYYDLYPGTAFYAYPYHSVTLTVLALVVVFVVSCEAVRPAFTRKRQPAW